MTLFIVKNFSYYYIKSPFVNEILKFQMCRIPEIFQTLNPSVNICKL